MRRPELLVIDLDGTLLDPLGAVSDQNREALERADVEALEIIIATGRALSECCHVLDNIGYQGSLISASGALLVAAKDGETLDRRTIDPVLVEPVVEAIHSGQAPALVLKDRHVAGIDYIIVGEHDTHPVSDWWFEMTGATWCRVDRLENDPWPEATVRVGAVGTPEEFTPVVSKLQQSHGSQLLARHWEAVTSSTHAGEVIHLLEVFHPEADKWTMVRSYCRTQGLNASQTVAVGDGLNDVQLIEQSGLGVAMENADDRVLAVADLVTDSNHQHGVASLIHGLLDRRIELNRAGS